MRGWFKAQSRTPWGIAVLRTLVAAYMWALYATARKTFQIHPETATLLNDRRTFILGNWHSRLFMGRLPSSR